MKKPSDVAVRRRQERLPVCDRHTSVLAQDAEWRLQQNKTKTLLRSLPFDSWAFSLPVIPRETDPDLSCKVHVPGSEVTSLWTELTWESPPPTPSG
uniref:Uncharacterized protein n=1 Tax=Piliocolobus tephrosceles TaxID=591936 RepID=A0A8C9I4V6_9PRIM